MDVTFSQLSRLVNFIDKTEQETYPETPSFIHNEITGKTLESIFSRYPLTEDTKVLDIGCGQGPALKIFQEKGIRNAIGITLNDEDVQACRVKGFDVRKMDQSFLEFPDGTFDFVWARHVIEHSLFPYFTLSEYARVMHPGSMLYLEVPAPETSCRHETNPNHYSVFSKNAWNSLLQRSGFTVLEEVKFSFPTGMGPDEYWGYICSLTDRNAAA